MTDWDADGEQLRSNLRRVLSDIREHARERVKPTVEAARQWHIDVMHKLTAPNPGYVGTFRGEPGLQRCEVAIGNYLGMHSTLVAGELRDFENKLQKIAATLDARIKPAQDLTGDDVAAIIDLCAWVHSEWVRIHPFANGNGRIARLWANSIAMRYDLPPFVQLRPQPDGGYGAASAAAMEGKWQPMASVFRQMYREAIRR